MTEMETNGCVFPEELHYTVDMNLWVRKLEKQGSWRIGMTQALLWTAGKPIRILLKSTGTVVEEGKSIGSIESGRFFDTMRVPFRCTVAGTNELEGRRITPSSIYREHWLATLSVEDDGDVLSSTITGSVAGKAAAEKVRALRLRCFSELPDTEMVEIGTECSAVLARLNQLMENREKGFTVHLVTDDVTSPIEMVRWSDETRNRLVETRKVDSIYHFLVVKE